MSSIVEILPNLWIGHYHECGNLLSFNECNIDTVINGCGMVPFTIGKITKYDISISPDDNIPDMIHKMNGVLECIHLRLSKNKFILMYSHKGDQVDSTIILCYLMKYGKMDPKNAIQAISSKRTNEFQYGLLFKRFLFTFYETIQSI